jgi:hypothetical protein
VPTVTESQLQDAVIGLCKLFGIAWYHPYFSRRSVPGWPDLALCGVRGFMLRELKTEKGRVTPDQQRWGHLLRQAGQSWDVWRPADLHGGRVQAELEAIR